MVYPTETCYGLGANAFDEEAVKKVFIAKRRPFDKPITIIVSDLNMWEKCAYIDERAKMLIEEFLPGPLTIALKKKELIPDILNPKAIAARIPSHPVAFLLVRKAKVPITATSANISGKPPLYSAQKVSANFRDTVDLILDAGRLPRQKLSTIVDFTMEATPQITREGPISTDSVLKKLRLKKWEKVGLE